MKSIPLLKCRPKRLGAVLALALVLALMALGCNPERDQDGPDDTCVGDECIVDTDAGTDVEEGDVDDCDPNSEDCERLPGGGCRIDSHCPSGRYCSDGACVSETYICTLLGCDAQPGVCDASQRACVNAETCFTQNDCVGDYICFEQSCQTEEEICSVCAEGDECSYDVSTTSVTCEDPNRPCPQGPAYCEDGMTSMVCNDEGTYDSEECSELGCNGETGRCARAPGDGCFDAIDATDGYNGTIVWSAQANDYELDPETSCTTGEARFNTFGSDVAFVVDLPDGDTVFASMRTPTDYGSIYVVTDCEAIETSCLDVAPTMTQQGGEYVRAVSYKNETGAPQTLYIIADSGFGAEQSEAQFEIGTGTLICGPGATRCNGDNREVCSASGMSWEVDTICPEGCDDTTAQCNRPANDTCDGAYDIIALGGRFTGSLADYTAVYNQSGGSCYDGADGREAVFYVDLQEGDRVVAEMASSFDAVLWMTSDCSAAAAACVVSADWEITTWPETFVYVAPAQGRYYIFADAYSASASAGTFTLTVDVQSRDCTDYNQFVGCDGDSIVFCGDDGYSQRLPCATTCTDGQCDDPTGNYCYDAIDVMAAGGTYSGDIADFTAQYNTSGGSCSGSSQGAEAVFFVDLEAGERLSAEMFSTFDGVLWIMDDCASPAGSCLERRDGAGANGTESFIYTAARTGRYFIVADAWSASPTGTFELTVNVQSQDCTEFGQFLGCDGDSLLYCDNSGFSSLFSCATTCTDGQCDDLTGDACYDAIDVMAGGGTFNGDLADYTANHNTSGGSCSGTANGREAVFFVDLTEGDRLTATMVSTYDGVLWLMNDCGTPADSCLVRRDGAGQNGTETFAFIAEETGRYFIVADAWSASDAAGTFTLEVSVDSPNCFEPGEILGCKDGNLLEYCEEPGFSLTYACETTCTDSMCDEPRGDICYDAIPLGIGDSFTGSFADYANRFNPGTGTCIISSIDSQVGRDVVFAVQLDEGDILEATLTTNSTTAGMYVLDECTSVMDQGEACLYANPRSGTMEFYASATQLYYLVVDATSSALSDDFTLELDIRAGVCQPGTGACTDDVLTLCNSDGSEILGVVTCAYGCSGASCGGPEPANNTCGSAYEIDGSVRIQDDFARFRDDYNLQADGCVGARTPGKDAVYKVNLFEGDVITARVTQGTSTTNAIYVVKDCADLNDTCSAGARAVAGVAEVAYVAEQNESVYVVVDSTSSVNSGVFILDIEYGLAECMPSEEAICEDADTVRSCLTSGVYNFVTCHNGCEEGACLPLLAPYTQDFSDEIFPQEFTTGGDANWALTDATASVGTSSLKAGTIGNSQLTWVEFEIEYAAAGTLQFDWRVSSESGFDFLVFCANRATCTRTDNTGSISGTVGWQTFTHQVTTPGLQRFRWAYAKDGSAASGSDTGWIDNIRAFEN